MPAPERLVGIRVVAEPPSVDALLAGLSAGAVALRFAPDEALVVGVTSIGLDDPDAIIEPETGFVAFTVERAVVARHVEWPLPAPDAIGQGKVAGVPAKLAWLPDGRAWVVTTAAYAAELEHGLAR